MNIEKPDECPRCKSKNFDVWDEKIKAIGVKRFETWFECDDCELKTTLPFSDNDKLKN